MGDITVVGHGEASGSPDVFMATVGVSVRSRRIAGVMADVKAKARAVIDAVIDAGVAADDVRTAWMSCTHSSMATGSRAMPPTTRCGSSSGTSRRSPMCWTRPSPREATLIVLNL